MNFYNLYMLNCGWTPYSNIDIAYLHDGKIVRDSGAEKIWFLNTIISE